MIENDFSLLFPDRETRLAHERGEDAPYVTEQVIRELSLDWLLDMEPAEIQNCFSESPAVLAYRRKTLRDLVECPELGEVLQKVFPILRDISELRRLEEGETSSTRAYLTSITEVELYISCIETLSGGLAPLRQKLKSPAMTALADRMAELAGSDYYRELNEKLKELTQRVRDIRSITVGVNLDRELRVSDVGVLSINAEPFKSGDVIEKILRMNFKSDAFTCLAPLIPFDKSQSENQKQAMNHAMHTAIEDAFRSSVRSWKKIVSAYVLENTDFLLSVMPEIRFLLHAAALVRDLADRGYPLADPELAPTDELALSAEGLYNPAVALKLDEPVVENDFAFDEKGRIFVLTGPNRGGKSVITCAVGISAALVQMGLPAPARCYRLSPVDAIFTHFPDGAEDTIEKGRLGEECSRLEAIFSRVTRRSLVLLDESLCSTGSFEGSYIAGEVLAGFARVGCRVLFSTHLHELASSIDDINARCMPEGGACIDTLVAGMEEGKRSFRIYRARPDGKSYARDIADKFGLSYEQIVRRLQSKEKN